MKSSGTWLSFIKYTPKGENKKQQTKQLHHHQQQKKTKDNKTKQKPKTFPV